MSVWFTSDLHVQHVLMAALRGFRKEDANGNLVGDPDAHAEAIIEIINSMVRHDDILWCLGDMTLGKLSSGLKILSRINGRKQLVYGNHDKGSPIHQNAWKIQGQYLEVFESVQAYAKLKMAGVTNSVLLSHFPWNGDGEGSRDLEERYSQFRLNRDPSVPRVLIHGHTHSDLRVDGPDSIHVGWDAWKRPVHLDEVRELAISLDMP
jgi:calcineurin-like phosphoesterase family protein